MNATGREPASKTIRRLRVQDLRMDRILTEPTLLFIRALV